MSNLPIAVRWDGESFKPFGRSFRESNETRVIGQTYILVDHEQRSEAAHRFYFAQVAEYWAMLPEQYGVRWQNPEALRKFALIKTGYATQQQHVCGSAAEAMRLASVVAGLEEYSLCEVSRNVVTIWRAESQKYRAMGKKRFHQSKDDTLSYIASLIGVAPSTLARETEKAA